MQVRSRDADVKNQHVGTVGKGEAGMDWEIRIGIYTKRKTMAMRSLLTTTREWPLLTAARETPQQP